MTTLVHVNRYLNLKKHCPDSVVCSARVSEQKNNSEKSLDSQTVLWKSPEMAPHINTQSPAWTGENYSKDVSGTT